MVLFIVAIVVSLLIKMKLQVIILLECIVLIVGKENGRKENIMKPTTNSKTTAKVKSQPIKMTKQEIKEWDDLYQYVRSEILQYPTDIALSKHMIMRLKGLREGKFYANKNHKSMGNYSYYTILLTFKFCKQKILSALTTKKFTNEQNKINYIMVIIENNINDIALRLKAKEKSEKVATKQIDKVEIDIIEQDNKPQSAKTTKETNEQFNNLTKGMW
jgi:hypothetical protein